MCRFKPAAAEARSLAAFLAPILTSLVFLVAVLYPHWAYGGPNLISFEQGTETLGLGFDVPIESASYTVLSSIPQDLELPRIRDRSIAISATSDHITIPINADEPNDREYSIVVFMADEWIELVRQSEDWLYEKFNFERPGGYTILGRHSIDIESGEIAQPADLRMFGSAQIFLPDSGFSSKYPEIKKAVDLLRYLWRDVVHQGPTARPYNQFLVLSVSEKLSSLRDGTFAVMCQGFRDLYLHVSISIPGLTVRAVDAINYGPQFPDLISYSHATAEVWVEALDRWVLVDPWLGAMVTDHGEPVGAADLHNREGDASGLAVVPLIDTIPRTYVGSSGLTYTESYYPASLSLSEFSCLDVGCAPGYLEYFRNFYIRGYEIIEQH